MTVVDAWRIVVRRWYVVVACLLVVAATAVLAKSPTVYWTQTDIRLVFTSKLPTNTLYQTSDSVIATAGLLVSEFNATHDSPRLSSDDVTIVDAGITDGVLVRLPNAGGQWATNFNEPRIDVQVSGSDPEEVRSRTKQVVAQLVGLLASRQAAAQVASAELINAIPTPATPVVVPAHGSRSREYAAIGLLGVGLTFGTTLFVDQFLLRRRRQGFARRGVSSTSTPQRPIPRRRELTGV